MRYHRQSEPKHIPHVVEVGFSRKSKSMCCAMCPIMCCGFVESSSILGQRAQTTFSAKVAAASTGSHRKHTFPVESINEVLTRGVGIKDTDLTPICMESMLLDLP